MDAGAAVGVVSLVLQVSQGLLDYYQAWEGYSDDVRQAYNCIADLNKTFALLDKRLRSMSTVNPGSNVLNRVAECLTACTGEVQHLERKLMKLHKQDPKGFTQKAHAGVLRAFYPFRASTLEKLKEIVQDLMVHLKLAIQVLLLENSVETDEAIAQIKVGVDNTNTLVAKIHTTTLDTQTQTVAAAAGVEMLLKAEETEQRRQVLRALEAPNPSIEHDEARRKYEPGTGDWFLKCQAYQNWVTGLSPRLWLHGKAGCCKTVLCSTIIEDVKRQLPNQPGSVLAYFYFSFSDTQKQSYTNLLLSLVTELSRRCAIHPKLLAAYNQTPEKKPDTSILEEVLIDLLRGSRTSYLIIDALDECPEGGNQREQVMQGLERVANECTETRILLTSRKEMDILEFMQTWSVVQVAVNEDSVNADIDIFVKNTLATNKKLPSQTKEEIERMFHQKSDGMFRWAALQLQSILNLKILRPRYISAALREMPRSLDETYERILGAIDEMYYDEVRLALEWLAFSESPLSVAEVGEACSIRLDETNEPFLDECNDEIISGLLSVLSPLVLIEPVPEAERMQAVNSHPMKFSSEHYVQRIRLAHFSVKEYLMSSRLRASRASSFALGSNGHYDLAQRCCAYVLYFTSQCNVAIGERPPPIESSNRGIRDPEFMPDLIPSYPLLLYAVSHWTRHQGLAENGTNAPPMNVNLHLKILQQGKVRKTWLFLVGDMIDCGRDRNISWYFAESDWQEGTKAIYWTSLLGFYHTTSMLCEQATRSDLNHVAGHFKTALEAAAFAKAVKVVGRLLEAGADVNPKDGGPSRALIHASIGGNTQIVQMLIDKGAIINAPDELYSSALYYAVYWHNVNVIKLLIDNGADPTAADEDGSTPLHLACSEIYLDDIVKLLLDKDPDLTVATEDGWTPLHCASSMNHAETVKLLLHKGADLTVVTKNGLTALHLASWNGHIDVVKLLLDKGIEVNIDQDGWTALHFASYSNHVDVVKLLLDRDFDIRLDNDGCTPLYLAAAEGHVDVVKLLLDKGPDMRPDKDGYTPLFAAAVEGHFDVVKLLLDRDPDMRPDNDGCTPLFATAVEGHAEVVKLLLKNVSTADFLCRSYSGRSPIFYAVMTDQNKFFDVLQTERQSNSGNHFGISALSIAARCGREQIVDRLLTIPDIDINSADSCGRTPIWWALKQGHVEIAIRLEQHAYHLGLCTSMANIPLGNPVLFRISGRWCDICLASMDEPYYGCEYCDGGDFDVCRECYKLGGHCLVESHTLTPCKEDKDL